MARAVTETRLDRLFKQAGDVLERQEKAGLGVDYSTYYNDPVGFANEVLHVVLWAKQIAMLESVRDNPQTSVRGGVGMGKDFTGACAALWWMYARRGLVLVTSAGQRQVRDIFFGRELRRLFRAGKLPGTMLAEAVKPPDGWEGGILGFTSNDVDKLTGFHDQHVLGILSEAQGLEEDSWVAMRSCAVRDDDRLLAVGNPTNPVSRFFQTQKQGSGWEKIVMSVFEHPNIVEGRTVIPGGPEAGWLDRVKQEEGEGSAYWKGRILAEFPERSVEALLRGDWLKRAVDRWNAGILLEESDDAIRVGCDVARLGSDATACAIYRAGRITGLSVWHLQDTMKSVANIQALQMPGMKMSDGRPVRLHEIDKKRLTIVVDVTGGAAGPGVADRLRELGYTVVDFHASTPPEIGTESRDPRMRRAKNAKAEGWLVLRDLLRDGQLMLPPDPLLLEELAAMSHEEDKMGRVVMVSKPALRAMLGRSPDRADAVMLAVAGAGSATTGGTVGVGF